MKRVTLQFEANGLTDEELGRMRQAVTNALFGLLLMTGRDDVALKYDASLMWKVEDGPADFPESMELSGTREGVSKP